MQMTFKFFVPVFLCLALLVVSGCGDGGSVAVDSAFAQTRVGATGVQWEYKVVNVHQSNNATEEETMYNQLGLDGWEPTGAGLYGMIFKRPKR